MELSAARRLQQVHQRSNKDRRRKARPSSQSKEEKEARGILGAPETPAQKAKKAADKTKKEKANAKQLQTDESGAGNSSTTAAAQAPVPIAKCSAYDGCKVKGFTLMHRKRCYYYNKCIDKSCKFAHEASVKVNKSDNLPVITAATEPAKNKKSGAEFVRHNSPSCSSK